jgi:signal recognition particle receptor subunit beta
MEHQSIVQVLPISPLKISLKLPIHGHVPDTNQPQAREANKNNRKTQVSAENGKELYISEPSFRLGVVYPPYVCGATKLGLNIGLAWRVCYKRGPGQSVRTTVPFINFPAREINCKLVYYGPGLGGKTANLQWIYDHTGSTQKGKMISLATETDRTLFFDFLPIDLGTVRGFKTRIHLYTVPGQVFYEASRKLILKGADGVVFVADSQEERLDANLETLDNLREHLKEHKLDFQTIPYVLQLNKRDLPGVLSVEELTKQLQVKSEPVMEGVAVTGQGVFETLREVAKLVLAELKKGT